MSVTRRGLFATLAALVAGAARAADATQPHPHQGVLKPYTGAPPTPTLTEDDLLKLAKGEAVQDVHAEPAVIWSRVTSFANYPEWVDGCYECEPYDTSGGRYKVRFVIGAMLIRVEYFCNHLYKPDDGYMTWTLDYSRLSDLDDTVGFWRLVPLPDKPGWTRVFYSVEVKLSGWVPGWVEDMLAKSGLRGAVIAPPG
jgi:hypothetical protein